MSDRTEEPTPRRLRRARSEGDAGVSVFAGQAVSFLVATALLPGLVSATVSDAAHGLRDAVAAAAHAPGAARFDALSLARSVLALVVPLLAAVAASSAIVQAAQAGGVLATSRIAPRLDRLDPIAGLRNLFSSARLFAVVRALVAGTAVAALAWAGVRDHLADLARTAGDARGARTVGRVIGAIAGELGWRVALVGLALGVVDLLVTRRTWLRRLRMTKDEVRREHREAEGDPRIKAARERAHQELFAQAAVANVRHASVVVVNPTHLACALRYDAADDAAPVVVARGEGDLAASIVRAALSYGVPVVHDVPLARALVELPLGDAIPEALYEAVAAILGELAAS